MYRMMLQKGLFAVYLRHYTYLVSWKNEHKNNDVLETAHDIGVNLWHWLGLPLFRSKYASTATRHMSMNFKISTSHIRITPVPEGKQYVNAWKCIDFEIYVQHFKIFLNDHGGVIYLQSFQEMVMNDQTRKFWFLIKNMGRDPTKNLTFIVSDEDDAVGEQQAARSKSRRASRHRTQQCR